MDGGIGNEGFRYFLNLTAFGPKNMNHAPCSRGPVLKTKLLRRLAGFTGWIAFSLSAQSEPAGLPEFHQRLSKLREHIATTGAELADAEAYPRQAGLIDVQIASYFADYIAWELEHPEVMKHVLASCEQFISQAELTSSQREQRYHAHLDRELKGSMALLENALSRLSPGRVWPQATESIAWGDMVFRDGNFRVGTKPVFPGGFNMLDMNLFDHTLYSQWRMDDEEGIRGFLTEMRAMGVGLIGTHISVTAPIKADGTIDSAPVERYAASAERYRKLGLKTDLMLHWGGKSEILEARWPGITKGGGNGVPLDIDHPGIKELVGLSMSAWAPTVRDRTPVVTWDLANEPFFDLDDWSPHALRRYQVWLRERHGSIAKLNRAWSTDYPSFGDIPLPKESPRDSISPGQWYDRVTFHDFRVASFFAMVATEIRRHVPDAIIHLKGQDNNSLGPMPWAVTDGIEREMQTAAVDLHGVDTRPLPITEPRMAAMARDENDSALLNYDDSSYGFHWLGQSFLYDYLTSLGSGKPIVDFEYHAFSINPIRVTDINPRHANATLWLAHLHGLIGNIAWYWQTRSGADPFPDRWFESWFHASISTQPLLAAEYFHTMGQLNRLSEEVVALASDQDVPVRLLVSKPSYIHNQSHINALHRAYEGLCFQGKRVGFITGAMLEKGGLPEGCETLVLADAQYVSAATLDALKQAKQRGATMLRFGQRSPEFDPHGKVHPPEALGFLESTPAIDYGSAEEVHHRFSKALGSGSASISVRRAGHDHAFGILHRQVTMGDRSLLLLVNTLNEPVEVEIIGKDNALRPGRDLITGEGIASGSCRLAVQGVRLIEVQEGDS